MTSYTGARFVHGDFDLRTGVGIPAVLSDQVFERNSGRPVAGLRHYHDDLQMTVSIQNFDAAYSSQHSPILPYSPFVRWLILHSALEWGDN